MMGLKEFLELFEPKISDVVVDKPRTIAQELTKNWVCKICNQENYFKNTACIFGCSYVHNEGASSNRNKLHTKAGHWNCSACTLLNPNSSKFCSCCRAAKPSS